MNDLVNDPNPRPAGPAGATTRAAAIARAGELAEKVLAAMEQNVLGQPAACELLLATYIAGGHALLEGVPGIGKTSPGAGLFGRPGARPPAHPVHPRPDAHRRGGHQRLRSLDRQVPAAARADLQLDPDGRRDQPHAAQDPVGAARRHAGRPRHHRRRAAGPARRLLRDRHPESGRVRRHLSAARGPARPLPDPHRDGAAAARPGARALPAGGGRPARLRPPSLPAAVLRAGGGAFPARREPPRARRRRAAALSLAPGGHLARVGPARAGGQPARRAGAARDGAGPRPGRRARVRAAGRFQAGPPALLAASADPLGRGRARRPFGAPGS